MNHPYREDLKFEQHRLIAEWVIYNKNWLPAWFICWYLDGFCEHGERYLNGEAQPPLPIRVWWGVRPYLKFVELIVADWLQRKEQELRKTSLQRVYLKRLARNQQIAANNRRLPGSGRVLPSIARPGTIIPLLEGETIRVIDFNGQPGAVFMSGPKTNVEMARDCGYDPPWSYTHFNNLVIGCSDRSVYTLDGYEVDGDLLSHQLAAAYFDGAFPQGPFYQNGSELIRMLKRGGPDFIAARQIIEGLRIRPIPLTFPLYKKTGRWHERLQQEVDRRSEMLDVTQVGDAHVTKVRRDGLNEYNYGGMALIPRAGLTMEQAERAFRGLQSAASGLAKVTPSRKPGDRPATIM